MSLKLNVVANYFGAGWQALLGIAFLPLYIRYLGVEAYGLVGIFAVLQAWLGLLDMGTRPALGREVARFTAGAHDASAIRSLIRSVEFVIGVVAVLIALAIWRLSGWFATDWVRSQHLFEDQVSEAFTIMGFVIALSFVRDLYIGCLSGMQRQVALNVIIGSTATVRAMGAIGVLAWISPTIEAFFLWQGLMSIVSLTVLAGVVYRSLPQGNRPTRFSKMAILSIGRFSGGTAAAMVLAMLLTQVDKILLSRLLTLEMFGYYALAGAVASALSFVVAPIATAYYPRLTELVTHNDQVSLRAAYHLSAQLVTVVGGATAAILVAFAYPILSLWTGNNEMIVRQVGPLMTVLVVGNFLNALMWIPYQTQLAHGWTSLAVKINIVAVAILLPAILWIVPIEGAIGAAWIWVALNIGYVVFDVGMMHRTHPYLGEVALVPWRRHRPAICRRRHRDDRAR